MKGILTLFLFLTISSPVFAQEKIAVIDFEKVINNSQLKFEVDYIYNEVDSFVTQLGREQVTIYQENSQEALKRYQGGCMTFEEMRKIEENLKNQESKLLALEKFAVDTLPLLKQKLDFEVRKIIQNEIEDYRKSHEFQFIWNSNIICFHAKNIEDISYSVGFQLNLIYNLPHRKLVCKQVIYNVKKRYNLNQELHERFSYAILKQNSR